MWPFPWRCSKVLIDLFISFIRYIICVDLIFDLGDEKTVEELIQNGTNVDAENEEKWTPLDLAARFGDYSNLKLCTRLINVDWMIYLGREKIAELLVQKGANINSEDFQKATPLHIAARYTNTDCF